VRKKTKAARTRKLAIWGALPPYLGGKRRLCPLIFREIDRILPRRHWRDLTFLDGFLGGGSVSLYAKAQGFRVISCDIAQRAVTVGEALIANSRVRLTREDVLRLVAPADMPAGRVEQEYSPSVFTQEQARFIDRALAVAEDTGDKAKAALIRLLAIRVALLAHPMSQVRAGTIHRISSGDYESVTESCLYHYVDGLRLTRPQRLWQLAQQLNAGVFQGEAQVLRESVLEALPRIQAAVAYFDPPYPGVMSYEKEYKIIDEILEGAARTTSPFTAKDGASLLDTLFDRARHIPVWLLSLGNAVVGLDDLEAKMTRLGRQTRAIAIRYQHLPAVATAEKKRENREFLVIGWDPEAPLFKRLVERRGIAAGLDHSDAVAHIEVDASRGSAEPSPLMAGLHDREQSPDPGLSVEVAALGRHAVPEIRRDPNDPGAGSVEAGLGEDLEGRGLPRAGLGRKLGAPRHAQTFPDAAPTGQAYTEETK
jgi:adenine-specific DNA methylase